MNKKEKIKLIIALAIFIVSIIIGFYVGGWILFFKPIFVACNLFDIGALTGIIILKTIVKCFIAPIVFAVICSIGNLISVLIIKI